jgi:hypothetical protein
MTIKNFIRRAPRAPMATWLMMALWVGLGASVARSGRADAPAGRYMVGGGVVVDTKTGLSWTQAASSTEMTEEAAQMSCATNMTAGGGWRLPSVGELQSIIDETRYNPAIDTTAFPNTPATDFFWTQSGYESFPGFGWAVSFLYGLTTVYQQGAQNGWVRCVKP